jgi:hypothetical protein
LHLCNLVKCCLSLILLRLIEREKRRCSRSSRVVYTKLSTDLLNIPVLANLELLVSSVAENTNVKKEDCFT